MPKPTAFEIWNSQLKGALYRHRESKDAYKPLGLDSAAINIKTYNLTHSCEEILPLWVLKYLEQMTESELTKEEKSSLSKFLNQSQHQSQSTK